MATLAWPCFAAFSCLRKRGHGTRSVFQRAARRFRKVCPASSSQWWRRSETNVRLAPIRCDLIVGSRSEVDISSPGLAIALDRALGPVFRQRDVRLDLDRQLVEIHRAGTAQLLRLILTRRHGRIFLPVLQRRLEMTDGRGLLNGLAVLIKKSQVGRARIFWA